MQLHDTPKPKVSVFGFFSASVGIFAGLSTILTFVYLKPGFSNLSPPPPFFASENISEISALGRS